MKNKHALKKLLPLANLHLGLKVAKYESIYIPAGENPKVNYEQLLVTLFRDLNGFSYDCLILDVDPILNDARQQSKIPRLQDGTRTLGFSI